MFAVKRVLSLITFGLVMAILWGAVSAYHLTASTDKILYETSDSLGISGTVETSSSVTVYVEIYNSSDISIKNGSTSSAAAGNVSTFSISIPLANFSPGNYYALVYNTPGDSVRLEFEVVVKKMLFKVRLLNSSDGVVMVDTSDIVTSPGYLGGNFSDFLAAGYQVHYGNASSILGGGKVAHFALINESASDVFDTIYLDDDPRFELYNSLEDNSSFPMVETPLKKGDSVGDYIVAEVEFTSGNKVLLAKPSSSSLYTGGDTVYYMVVAKDKAGNILGSENIKVELRYSNGTVIDSTSGTIQNGYFNGSFTAPSVAGTYLITVNDTLGMEVFSVEAFKLFGKITDINGNPTTTFAPNPVVKLTAVAKDMSGNLLTLTSAEALVVYPNGTQSTVQLTKTEQGVYSGELDLKGAPTGEYGVKFRASDNTTTQEISMGFTIAESRAELYAINVQFIDQADEGGMFVSAFHPSSNVTMLALLTNVTKGGLMASGPEGAGMIDIDNASTLQDECNTSVELIELKDDREVSYLGNVTVQIMNLTNFMASFAGGGPKDEGPPEGMLRQCMVVVGNLTKQGAYRAKVRITHNSETSVAGTTFGVQELYAYGSTVDFKGEEFGFNTPNSTLRVKLNVQNLLTREFLPPESIISANIVSLRREFPSFQKVDVSGIATSVNVSGGVLSFKAPNLEGFFSMKFRFKVNVSNEIKEGVGGAFFMLKKYIIWAEPQCKGGGFGPCVFSGKGNVSLKVYIADSSKGTLLDRGDTSSALCSTCDGLVAKIKMLRNDQLGREIPSSEFTTYGGSVTNGTATLNISSNSSGFASGWYGADIEVYNPADPNESYFGFGWFEIRNFFVEVMSVSVDEATGNLTASWSGWEGNTYAVNRSIAFAVIPRNPFDWSILPIQNVSIASVQRVDMWPPVDAAYTLAGISQKTVYMDMGGFKQAMNVTVVNITGISKEGMYRANVKVTTANGSDIGTMWFDVASFQVNVYYRGMDMWPPTFGSDENLTVMVNATNFDGTPHALDVNKTRLASFFDIKRGHPLKRNSTTTCSNNVCNISIELSGLKSGDYEARLKIVDTSGAKKETGVWFVIRNLVVGVPSIDEVWLWESDTAKKEIKLDGIDISKFGDIVPPGNYTSSYKGCVDNMIENEWFFGGLNITKRPLCFFHNTTRLWVSVNANFSSASSAVVNEIITDPYGGKWRVESLNKRQITLRGINVLAKTGAWLNASLSQSGIIKLGRMEEQWLGGWDPSTGGNRGLDLDGDGNTNGTAYIAIADSQTSGIYDTLFFSLDNNFSSYGSVNDPPAKRTFASGKFTLLSVDPRADRIRIYTANKGDWANLGDARLGQMVNVPVMVATPAGTPVPANVSIKHLRKESLKGPPEITTLSSPPTATINGTGEVQFNLSKYNLSSGIYAFEIEVQVNDSTEILEEWMWPRVNVRAFLVSGGQGTAGYIGEFKPLPVYRYDWSTYGGNIPELFEVNASGLYFPMTMDQVSGGPSPGNCTEPGDAGSDPTNYTLQSGRLTDANSSYYYYLTAANASTLWIKKGSCDFASGAEVKSVNDTVNIVLNNRNYTMSVLAADANAGGLVVIGVSNDRLNQKLLNNPLRQDPEKRWSIISFTIGGATYNAILANASMPYPMCKQWNIQDCAKAAYFTADGNYSSASETLIGEPIMPGSDLYLARVGPSPWDGILIANSSQVGVRPGLDIPVADGYTPAFATLNESQLGFDLNLDNDTGDVFYAVTFDDRPDGIARATSILVDDELNITQDWWGEGWNGSLIINPKDFYGNESGIFELRGNLPSAIWGGQVGFAPRNESMPYEEQPWWDVKMYNGTHMLLMKDKWSIKKGDNITFVIRAYDFDQKAIVGANVTIEKVFRFTPVGPKVLKEGTDYILKKVQDTTDAKGYGILTIAPKNGTWEKGDYMVTLSVSKSGGSERIEMWLRVGGW
ncbi:hypothetical protein [Candidatus Pyrohabitans sp.]